jgi:hypothetical protein
VYLAVNFYSAGREVRLELVEAAGAAAVQCGLKVGAAAEEEISGEVASNDTSIPPAVTAAVAAGGVFEGGLMLDDASVTVAPADAHAAEKHAFLEDLISGGASSSGGRLADWLTRVVDQVR